MPAFVLRPRAHFLPSRVLLGYWLYIVEIPADTAVSGGRNAAHDRRPSSVLCCNKTTTQKAKSARLEWSLVFRILVPTDDCCSYVDTNPGHHRGCYEFPSLGTIFPLILEARAP